MSARWRNLRTGRGAGNSPNASTLLSAIVAGCAILAGCFGDQVAGGGSATDVGNISVAGRILDGEGRGVAGAQVRLRPSRYVSESVPAGIAGISGIPLARTGSNNLRSAHEGHGDDGVRQADVITDRDGRFRFPAVDTGDYRIEAVDSLGRSVLLPVALAAGVSDTALAADTLRRPTVLEGSVQLPAPAGAAATVGTVRIYGTERSARIDSLGRFRIPIPRQARVSLRVEVPAVSAAPLDVPDVVAGAADTVRLDTLRFGSGCGDLACDTATVRAMLDTNGWRDVSVSRVSRMVSGRLVELNFSNNRMTLWPDALARLTAVQRLFLEDQNLDTLPAFVLAMPQLHSLSLSKNRLDSLPGSLATLGQLTRLNVGHNPLGGFPAVVRQLPRLSELTLTVTGTTQIPAWLGELENLRLLNLATNKLTSLDGPEWSQLRALEELWVQYNGLSDLPAGLMGLPRLRHLPTEKNAICAPQPEVEALLDRVDPGWRTRQNCR